MKHPIIAGVLAATLIISVAFFAGSAAIACDKVRASWYGTENNQTRTATGERYTGNDLTAAHKTLPFGTKLRVTYKGKSVVVRINDRGPYIKGRSLDLSRAAADRIGLRRAGVGVVCIERVN
jgi:rare lipoprotein A